jgi:hypothetical protein
VLVRQLAIPGVRIDAALGACGIDGQRRPQTLSVDEWLALRVALGPLPEAMSPAEAAAKAQSARSRAASVGAKKARR